MYLCLQLRQRATEGKWWWEIKYDSHALLEPLCAYKIEPVLPMCGKSRKGENISGKNYKRRNLVERFIGKLKEPRKVATHYDKKAVHYKNFVVWAAIMTWINPIC